MAEFIARLCATVPIERVSGFMEMGWDVVMSIHRKYLELVLGPPKPTGSPGPRCRVRHMQRPSG